MSRRVFFTQRQILNLLFVGGGIGFYFYFLFIINPALYYTAQEPVFFFDKYFFREFLSYPGGLLEYISALLAQFFYTPWLGALLLASIIVAIFISLRQYIQKTIQLDPALFALLPITLLLIAHNNYKHSLVIDLVILTALLFALVYVALGSRGFRIAFLLIVGPLLYFSTGFSFLLFGLFALFYEILNKRQLALSILILVLIFVLPLISGSGLFMIRMKHAFWHPAFPNAQMTIFLMALYLIFPLWLFFMFVLAKVQKSIVAPQKRLWFVVQAIVIVIFIFSIPLLTFDKSQKTFWQFTYYARMGEWHKLLGLGEKTYPNTPQIEMLINRALSHTGQMGSRMFAYRQDYDLNGLFLMDDAVMSTPLIRSDLYFDLGHFNEAKHWAHEATAISGETCWILQRLALLYLIYDEKEAARLYLNKLKRTIPLKNWARQYERYLKEGVSLKEDPTIAPLLNNKVTANFLSFVHNPMLDLPKLLEANPHNKIAADYLMASLLLTKQLQRFVHYLGNYDKTVLLPLHYQEALIFYIAQVRESGISLADYNVDPKTLQRFQAFQSSYHANRQNRTVAQKVLAGNFSDTYWYYLLFHQKGQDV